MINIQFNLRNPFSNRFQSLKLWNGSTPFKNKFWEIEIIQSNDIIDISLRYSVRQSHAGLYFCLGLFGYSLNFMIYDNRHWDHIENSWED